MDLPTHILRSVARFRLRVHLLRIELNYWNENIDPKCDLCDAHDDAQDEQHVLFKCTHPHVCNLRRKNASLFNGLALSLSTPESQVAPFLHASHHVPPHAMRSFLNQNNNKLHPLLHELLLFYEQASSQSV